MAKNTRIIVIDNVLELDQIRLNKELDINSWQFDDRNKAIPVSLLIKNALRSNPDWLIIAESRGQEMIEVLNSALTGIPIITTLHSESVDTIVPRMVSMVKMNDKKMEDDDIKSDIYSHIHFYIYVRKKVEKDGKISRFISDLIFINNEGQKFVIFDRQKDDKNIYLDSQLCDLLNIDRKVLK